MAFNRTELLARYHQLCELRDATYAKSAPVQAQLDAANAECEAARLKAAQLSAEIDAIWGGPAWLEMKKEIADIARFLGKIAPREAAETVEA